ncbi:MAG: hypothetical protein OQK77_01180 [Psychromonas sp.]|nr:hypothetical protein [Psychromonas sp.]
MSRFIAVFSLFFLSLSVNSQPYYIHLSNQQVEKLGLLIWKNEGQQKLKHLTTWNRGEDFPSLGLGHFIWYPNQQKGRFKEQFPELLSYFEAHGVQLPTWLDGTQPAPWKSREQFYKEFDKEKLRSLRIFLRGHLDLQVRFIMLRLEKAIPQILAACTQEQKNRVKDNLERLTATSQGVFVLLDYINFKGEGLSQQERYQGEGWGVKDVLLAMPKEYQDPLRAFGFAADEVLTRRVKNAPRDESRWLKGWRVRVHAYQHISVN